MDGYNDSLRVGYEYVTPAGDADWYDPDVVRELDRRMTAGGPCIDPIPALRVGPDAEAAIRAQVEAFMDTLRTHGVI